MGEELFISNDVMHYWPAVIIHLQNGIVLLLILAMVLGISGAN